MQPAPLVRAIDLRDATAINVATMIGAGPLITIPLVVAAQHGSISLGAWIAGALVALCDGFVYAELASRYPRTGGAYVFLREAFGADGLGALVAFVFVWQFSIAIPLTVASGFIGFAGYAAYVVPALAPSGIQHALAAVMAVVVTASLYRPIPHVARTARMLGAVALATLLAITIAGFSHPAGVPALFARAFDLHGVGLGAFGAALVITVYDYTGYDAATKLGDEAIEPTRTIPAAIVVSVVLVAIAYVALNLSVFALLPIGVVATTTSVASLVVERAWGTTAAQVVTVGILVTAFASTYGLLLAAARVPYAAARDGAFLRVFDHLHPSGHHPDRALLALGALTVPATLLPLDEVIADLTAVGVLLTGLGASLALVRARAFGGAAPFRVPLYPLPPLIASIAWCFLFWSSGPKAMLIAAACLALGTIIFLVRARRVRAWPFAAAALAMLLLICTPPRAQAAPLFGHARLERVHGRSTLLVDDKPFFFWGAAFFYPRIAPNHWQQSLQQLSGFGINTIDLYVPWNWHETSDGVFDFDGHSNPRRDLRRLLAMIREQHLHIIVRPGPVIRNEWRNGGYPAWLLTRPEYGMPLHDVLEGRYPATATLQNAHSDDAAAQWMANATHMRYSARWLHTVLREFAPVADLVLAVQLDDDQGAYIDNQTYPAPHLHAYLDALQRTVRDVVGPTLPTFINTYDMKVPASSPVWPMGNWYQSDAYTIAEHDRIELDFTTAALTTYEAAPLAYSEFQAGWLAAPEDPVPRGADPSNTALALAEILAWGAHGVIDFPLQDTTTPFAWEAPFSNARYHWDAALSEPADESPWRLVPSARAAPTAAFGRVIATYGSLLAQTQRRGTIALAYPIGIAPNEDNDIVAERAAHLKEQLRTCAQRELSCDVIDAARDLEHRLDDYHEIVIGALPRVRDLATRSALTRAKARHQTLLQSVPTREGNGVDLLDSPTATFAVATNWTDRYRRVHLNTGDACIAPRGFAVIPLRVPRGIPVISLPEQNAMPITTAQECPGRPEKLGSSASATPQPRLASMPWAGTPILPNTADASKARITNEPYFGSGNDAWVMDNGLVHAAIVNAGARVVSMRLGAYAFSDAPSTDVAAAATTFADATGLFRDDVSRQYPPSPTDRIAKYTHSYPAGMFNRAYKPQILENDGARAVLRFTYDAPDVVPHGAQFEKTYTLEAHTRRLIVDERFTATPPAAGQHLVIEAAIPILPVPSRPAQLDLASGFTVSDDAGRMATLQWLPGSVTDAHWQTYRANGTLSLTTTDTVRFVYAVSDNAAASTANLVAREREWLRAHPSPP